MLECLTYIFDMHKLISHSNEIYLEELSNHLISRTSIFLVVFETKILVHRNFLELRQQIVSDNALEAILPLGYKLSLI